MGMKFSRNFSTESEDFGSACISVSICSNCFVNGSLTVPDRFAALASVIVPPAGGEKDAAPPYFFRRRRILGRIQQLNDGDQRRKQDQPHDKFQHLHAYPLTVVFLRFMSGVVPATRPITVRTKYSRTTDRNQRLLSGVGCTGHNCTLSPATRSYPVGRAVSARRSASGDECAALGQRALS